MSLETARKVVPTELDAQAFVILSEAKNFCVEMLHFVQHDKGGDVAEEATCTDLSFRADLS